MKKKSPLVNEEFIKERYRSGNPLTADEIQNMFKDAFSHIFESCFQSEIEDELGYSKYDYQNKQTDNSRNGYSKKKLKSDIPSLFSMKFSKDEAIPAR